MQIHLNPNWGAVQGIEFRVKDVRKAVGKLKERGVKFYSGIRSFSWGKIAYFKDSEGNSLAIVEDK